jgi:hypothetical protein
MGKMKLWFQELGKDPIDATKKDWTLWTLLSCGKPRNTGRKDSDDNPIFTKENWVSIGDFLDNGCGTRYGARIHDLRHKNGYEIEQKKIHKSHYYRLVRNG